MDNRCVICNGPAPEGRQVCGECERRGGNANYGGAIFEPPRKPTSKTPTILKRFMHFLKRIKP